MSDVARRSLVVRLVVRLVLSLSVCAVAGALFGAKGAGAQIARSALSPFPSEAWFDTGHTAPEEDPAGPDITAIHVEYKTIGGAEWGIFRFQTARTPSSDYGYVTSQTGIMAYLDVDGQPGYEARFFPLRVEHFTDEPECGAIFLPRAGCANADVVLVVQTWESGAWQTQGAYGQSAGGGRQRGARGRDDGNGSCSGNGCRGWVFDNAADLAPSHGEDTDGVVVMAVPMASIAEPGARPRLVALPFDQYDGYFPQRSPSILGALYWPIAQAAHDDGIFESGVPCNDPAAPFWYNGGCRPDGNNFEWTDPQPGDAIMTPASVDLVEPLPSGLRAEVVTVHGPTTLELWRRGPDGALAFTGTTVAATEPGVYTLHDRAPGRRATYLLVDRGPQGVFAVYDHEGRQVRRLSTDPSLRTPVRPRPTARDAARAAVTSGSARGIRPVLGRDAEPATEVTRLVDVPTAGGVVRLPARDGGERVSALWVDGERHVAFPCASEVACALLPPADPSLPPPLHRVALVEVNGARPTPPAPRAAPRFVPAAPRTSLPLALADRRVVAPPTEPAGEPALLVEHVRLPHPDLTQWWPAPLEEGRGIGWVWRSVIPELALPLDDAEGEVLAIELEALAWELAHEEHAFAVSLNGSLVDEVVFEGPRAQVRVALDTSLASGASTLTFTTVEGAGAPDESLYFRGAFLERVRAPSLDDGGLHGVVREGGGLVLDADAFVIVRTASGSERGLELRAGEPLAVAEGDEVAAVSVGALSSTEAIVHAPSLASVLSADTLVLVGSSAAGVEAARDAIAPFVTALEATDAVVVTPAMGLGAALGGADVVERVVAWLSAAREGPASVVVIGSATERPESELPSSSALHLPSPRRYAEGFNYASDAAPALDAYANGARLVSVTRVPVRSLSEAEVVATRLASAHAAPAANGSLVVADWSEDFSRSAARLYGALSSSRALDYLDAHVTGQSAGVSALQQAVHDGAGALWFVGHGSSKGLGGSLASPARFRSLATQGARPLTLVGLSCLAGNVASDFSDRMPEELFRKATTVQGALIGSSQTTMRVHERVGDALGAALSDGETTLSGVWRAAMTKLLDEGMSADELSAYSLLGDPTSPL